jgi:hypothetical protein
MIRGDLRYAKIVNKCRSIIESRINALFEDVDIVKRAGIEWKLLSVPNSEDSDISEMLAGDNDFITDLLSIFNESETRTEAVSKLDVVFTVYRQSTNLKLVEHLYDACLNYLNTKFDPDLGIGEGDVEPTESGGGDGMSRGMSLGADIERELNSSSEPEEEPSLRLQLSLSLFLKNSLIVY